MSLAPRERARHSSLSGVWKDTHGRIQPEKAGSVPSSADFARFLPAGNRVFGASASEASHEVTSHTGFKVSA